MPILEAKYPVRATIRHRDRRRTNDIQYVRFARTASFYIPETTSAEAPVVATMDRRTREYWRDKFPVRYHAGEFYVASTIGSVVEGERLLAKPRDWEWLVARGARVDAAWRLVPSHVYEGNSPILDGPPEVPPTHVLNVYDSTQKEDDIFEAVKDLLVVDGLLFERAREPSVSFDPHHPKSGFHVGFWAPHGDTQATATFRIDQKEFALRWLRETYGFEGLRWPPIDVKRPDLLSKPVEALGVLTAYYTLLDKLHCLSIWAREYGIADDLRKLPYVDYSAMMRDRYPTFERAVFPSTGIAPDADAMEPVIEDMRRRLDVYRGLLERAGNRVALTTCDAAVARWRTMADDYREIDDLEAAFAP